MATRNITVTGAGTYGQTTPNTGTRAAAVDDPIGSPDDASTYNRATTVGFNDDTFTHNAPADPSDVISDVTVNIRALCSSAFLCAVYVFFRIGGTDYASYINQIPSTSYSNMSLSFPTSPATGVAWTGSELNAMEIGYRLYVPTGSADVTQIYAVETYTAGGGGGGGNIPVKMKQYSRNK